MTADIVAATQDAVARLSRRLQRLEALPYNPYSPDADMFDHFSGDGTLDARWTTTIVLTGTITLPNATPSYARLATGGTANSTAQIDWASRFPLVGMASSVDMRWRVRFPTAVDSNAHVGVLLRNAAASRQIELGVVGSTSTGFFVARTIASTGTQATITTVPVDTAWHDWRSQTMPDRIRYYIDDEQVAEHTLTADSLQTDPLAPVIRALNLGTAADRQMDVDLFWVRESR